MKPMIDRVDPELRPAIGALEASGLDAGFKTHEDFLAFRRNYDHFADLKIASFPSFEGVEIEEINLTGYDGKHLSIRVYKPVGAVEKLPAFLWIHGGGFIIGRAIQDDPLACNYAKNLNCVVISVDYRLAPEFPFPAGLEDCYTALKWTYDKAGDIGVDPMRIAIGGMSAGAGLAAGLAQMARDRNEVPIIFQLLGYPMLDDRNIEQIDDMAFDTIPWTRAKNLFAWKAYLDAEPGTDETPLYAAAVRTENLSDLPPAYIYIGDLDLFLAENLEYARRLIEAGVPTEIHVYKNAIHGFDYFAPDSGVGHRCNDATFLALKTALER